MANTGAKFDNMEPALSEAEAGPIDMAEEPEVNFSPPSESGMDLDEPIAPQTEIKFDETGAMVENEQVPEEDPSALVNVLEPSSPEETKLKEPSDDGSPEYLKALAESQQQMAEYLRLQQEYQDEQQSAEAQAKAQKSQAYYASPDYVTKLCEDGGLDAEDPVHRQLVETRMDMYRQNQNYDQRIRHMEGRFQEQQHAQVHQRQVDKMSSGFDEAARQYTNAPMEVVSAAKQQAQLLVDQGMDPGRAVAESIKFVRLASREQPTAKTTQAAKRQSRLDQLNSAGPGRGARSHRQQEMSMADADHLVSRGGFFPN